MQYNIYPDLPEVSDFVATTGFFDGVHLGHLSALKRVVDLSKILNKPSCVITFWPHPRIVLNKDVDQLNLLSTLDEKKELIANAGIDNFIVIPFTREFSKLSAQDFIIDYLVTQIGVSNLIVGYDHHIGRGAQADFKQIKEIGEKAGILVEQVGANTLCGVNISSSEIRNSLVNGDLDAASQYLGYFYSLTGIVVHGKKIGRQIGFPTANILPNERLKLLPKDGIYVVEVILKKDNIVRKGMLSIGIRPTIDDDKQRTVEVNIFDFDEDIYGETITVKFVARLRDEWKFDTLEALRLQIIQDKINTLLVFNS